MALRRKFSQTKLFRALIVSGVLFLFFFFQPRFIMEPLRAAIVTVSWPAEKIFSFVAFEIRDVFHFFTSIGELKSENERLEKERLRLSAENAKLLDTSKENEELRSELGILPREKFDLRPAEVIGRDVSGLGNWLSIDQGSLRGIKKNMPVIVGAGVLIGRVADVFPSSARVMLISNPESLVNGVTADTDARGIGAHGPDRFRYGPQEHAQIGHMVVTSGLGGDMPKGLLIGTLQEPRFSGMAVPAGVHRFSGEVRYAPVRVRHSESAKTMKVFFLRLSVILTIIFFQLSFLDIIFPWFHIPLLLLSSVVAWTLVFGFPQSLRMTLPLTLLFDCISLGAVSSFSLYAVFLAYATSFLSRRLLIEHRGASLILYALFAAGSALGYQGVVFFLLRDASQPLLTELTHIPPLLSPGILFLSFALSVPLFIASYFVLKRFEEYLNSITQKQFFNVR
jgi:rod shape-determining protein MreC